MPCHEKLNLEAIKTIKIQESLYIFIITVKNIFLIFYVSLDLRESPRENDHFWVKDSKKEVQYFTYF